MNLLILDGMGVGIRVFRSRLVLENRSPFSDHKPRILHTFEPRAVQYDSIVVFHFYGYLTIEALHFLNRCNVSLLFMDHRGVDHS